MIAMHKDRWFALIMGVKNADGFISNYNRVIKQLAELEAQYRMHNPNFEMGNMWTCNNVNGRIRFAITRHCQDVVLKNKLRDIFNSVQG